MNNKHEVIIIGMGLASIVAAARLSGECPWYIPQG